MTPLQKAANLTAVTVPFLGFLASIVLLWGSYVTWRDVGILVVLYLLTCLGISMGFHRLLTHRAFETSRPVRYGLTALGSLAVEGSAVTWVADHRKHHNFADREGDPHSPHVGRGDGVREALAGLWHAHVGWLWGEQAHADQQRYAKDLVADPGIMRLSRLFFPLVGLSLLLPFAAGYALGGTLGAGLQALFWGGLIRIFLLHHITWSVNSICHFVGRRRFRVKDESRNVWWLSLVSLGEAWHHNHHAFPSSAKHGLRRWEIDVTGSLITLLERLGLVWNVVRISPEQQARRELATPRVEPGIAAVDG